MWLPCQVLKFQVDRLIIFPVIMLTNTLQQNKGLYYIMTYRMYIHEYIFNSGNMHDTFPSYTDKVVSPSNYMVILPYFQGLAAV